MRKGMKITIIIMLAMFIIGAMLMIIGIATGGTLRFNVDYFGRRVDTSSELYHGEESVGTFNDVDVRMDSGEVKIVRGSEYKVSYAKGSSNGGGSTATTTHTYDTARDLANNGFAGGIL